jgi:TolB-like protein/Flp pilus assembly protein TadD
LGRYEEAIQPLEKAIRLDPIGRDFYFIHLGIAYCFAGRYEEAIAAVKQAIESAPNSALWHLDLAAIYSMAGREEEARAEVAEVLRLDPKFSLERYAKANSWRKAEKEPWFAALRKAGMPEKPPLPLPDKPSIAVLPFVNMSGDPKQEYFSDGITEEIITALSKTPKMFVIARTSSFKYKGKEVDVRTVGRELGVRYVLEGSVRKGGDKVRITAQLVDAKTGSHLWAERYDRELKDIFATQDEITMKILTSLQVSLTEGEMTRMYAKGTNDLDAYLLFLQGWKEAGSMNKDGNFLGRQLAEKAIALDPKFAMAYNLLATTYMNEVILGLSEDPRVSLKKAMELTQKAIALDNSLSWPHALLGFLYTLTRQHDKGIAECEQAVNLEPNSAISYFYLSLALKYAGRPREAITMAKEAMRPNPIPTGFYYQNLTHLYCLTGQYEEAIKAGKEATRVAPNNFTVRAFLTVAYSLYGRQEEARIEATEVLRINPKFLVDSWAKTMPFKNEADKEMTIGALRTCHNLHFAKSAC